MSESVLNTRRAYLLGLLVQAVQEGHRIEWVDEDGANRSGWLRGIVDEHFQPWPADRDVRRAYLHITTDGGLETRLPMRRALDLYDEESLIT